MRYDYPYYRARVHHYASLVGAGALIALFAFGLPWFFAFVGAALGLPQ